MEDSSDAQFLEWFAFAKDRKHVLKELISGTMDFYFYHGLVALQDGDVEGAKALWAEYISKDPRGINHERMKELLCRLRISQWGCSEEDTRACIDYLVKELKLKLDHQQHTVSGRAILGKSLALPSSLSPDQASIKALLSDPSADLKEAGYPWALNENLSLLLRNIYNVKRPIPGIELRPEVYSVDFGSLPLHAHLTLRQLDTLLEMNPEHGRNDAFLQVYASKCLPSPDVVAEVDVDEFARFYDRLEPILKYSALLRALVLLGRMRMGSRRGKYDGALLRAYLEIPKLDGAGYMGRQASTMMGAVHVGTNYFQLPSPDNVPEDATVREYFDALFRQQSGAGTVTHRLPPGADVATRAAAVSAAVRTELQAWEDLVSAGLLDYKFLLGVLAEAKLTSGGDAELWLEVLRMSQAGSPLRKPGQGAASWQSESASPSSLAVEGAVRALMDRIDIDFAPWNPRVWARADAVTVDVHVKNVPELVVKLFEVNTFNYFSNHGDDLSGLDLDGLTAGYETVLELKDERDGPLSPLSRVLRRISFPQLQGKAGAFVVELIGNGKKARAVIQKGRLRFVERRPSIAGHALRVFREDGTPAAGESVRVFVQGREYRANAAGEVIVPFTTEPGTKRLLLCEGNVTTVDSFEHETRSFSLDVGVWMDGDSMIPGHEATLLLRPQLCLNGRAVPLELLEETSVSLRWSAIDKNDIVQELPLGKLTDGNNISRTVKVPNRTKLHVTLRGCVAANPRAEKVPLSSSENPAAGTGVSLHRMNNMYLRRDASGYHLCVLGWGGEPLSECLVLVLLKHRFQGERFGWMDGDETAYTATEPGESTAPSVSLCTDESGEVHLGMLHGVDLILAKAPSINRKFSQNLWHDSFSSFSYNRTLQGRVGDVLRVPYRRAPNGGDGALVGDKDGIQLLGMRPHDVGNYSEDMTDAHVTIVDGWVELHGLPAGDFELYMPWYNVTMEVHVVLSRVPPVAGTAADEPGPSLIDYVVGAARTMTTSMVTPLTLANVSESQGDLIIQLGGRLAPNGCVHVAFYHFVPPDDLAHQFLLDGSGHGQLWFSTSPSCATSVYHPAQTLSSEVMYVVERRRGGGLRSGNMLPRPQLLMHPREVKETETMKKRNKPEQ